MPDWRQLTWGMGLLTLLFLPIAYCLPTSPKWLHSKGRVEQCCRVLHTFASKTNVVLPENIQEIISNTNQIDQPEVKTSKFLMKSILKSPYYRLVALIMGYVFIATTFLYIGISFNAATLPGNLYVNNSINGVFEILAFVFLMVTMGYFRRRTLTVSSMIFASIVCLIIGIMLNFHDGNKIIVTAYQWLAFLGKFLISGTSAMIFIYAPEIYPTEVRSTGLSMAYMASRIGGVAATQIIVLQDKFPWLPYTIFGIATGTAGLAALWLPETSNQPIPQTLAGAELFFKTQNRIKSTE